MTKKKRTLTEEELDERETWSFNEGRIHADRKWIEAINERIAELEKQVGIPELRKLLKETKYGWKNEQRTDMPIHV